MGERTVTMQGKPLTLLGKELLEGEKAPNFEAVDLDLKPVNLDKFRGKPVLLISVPSLDTSVCSKESHHFNQEMEKFGTQVTALVISMDLPFAQKRWCGQEGKMNLQLLSDHQKGDFGEKYGMLIQELRLLARAVFILDHEGKIRHIHLCKEITEEPPYAIILQQVKHLLVGVR